MKKSLLSLAIIAIVSIFAGCATTQATQTNEKFEKEIVYYAKFPCMTLVEMNQRTGAEIDAEIGAAIIADCKRYDKVAKFGTPTAQQCPGGAYIVMPYMCVDKPKEEVK